MLRYQLEGVFYRFFYLWNRRAGAWYLDMGNDEHVSQVRGVKLNLGIDKLEAFKTKNVPPGSLNIVDSSETHTEPTLESFGSTVLVEYIERGEVEEVIPVPDIPDTGPQ